MYSDTSLHPITSLPPHTTLADMKTTVDGMCALAERGRSLGHGVIPGRISQDVVENWFGHQRQAGGANRNMTGNY